MRKKIRNWLRNCSRMQVIGLGFILLILCGTILLMLPISTKGGVDTGVMDALFTATSASCVTGLVRVDTANHWSLFGQIVILLLIQTGGLGFMTISVLFSLMLKRKIGLRERGLLSESVNALEMGGIVHLMKKILLGTFLVEGIGAFVLSIRFCGELGLLKGIYYGIFHAVSAFCNAGFDLMGYQGEYSSLVNYSGDWLVNLTIVALIIIGGIGFIVWDDVTRHGLHFRKYRVHSKSVLTTSAVLGVGGALLFSIFVADNLAQGLSPGETFLTCLFDSVTPRTAGFNTTDIAKLTDSSKLLSVILMFIGGSPGSTAGGIKTTTFLVLLLYVRANMKRTRGVNIFKRRIDDDAIKRASAVACTNMLMALAAVLIICGNQALDMRDVMLEAFSAISTVGMSTGITRELTVLSQVVIILLMYSGRVGSLSMALSFAEKKKISPYELPEEKILIG